MATRGRLWVGTSGWMYRHWVPHLPAKLAKRRWLEHLSRVFPTVEINASFYMLPAAATFEKWASETPAGFRFAVKASRYLTHVLRLQRPREPVERLLEAARGLGGKLGPILLQLPESLHARLDRLEETLAAFRDAGAAHGLRPRIAVEFRHASWFVPEVLAALRRHGAALTLAHSSGRWPMPEGDPITARFVYLRFHGAGYSGLYGVTRLRPWAAKIRRWRAAGLTVFAYFNNDIGGAALRDARTLMRLAGESVPPPVSRLLPVPASR